MTLDLRDRVALVTGGGTGMGRAISTRLAESGAHVAIAYSRSKQEAHAAAVDLSMLHGVRAEAMQANLRHVADCEALVTQTIETFGRLDVVVSSAGATHFIDFANLEAITESVWDDIFDVNLKGAFFVARAAGLWMRDNASGGVIVNVASTAAFVPRGSSLPYSVSKAALIHATKGLAVALAPRVRVNAVAPGLVLTRWWDERPPDEIQRIVAGTVFKRAMPPEDVADATMLLVTNESLSGQTLVVDLANVLH